jgi:hypothetical protein
MARQGDGLAPGEPPARKPGSWKLYVDEIVTL